jgi:hypothetical protein
MRGVVLSLSRLSSSLLVSLLVLSTHVLCAQRTPTLEESTVQLPDAPSRIATVSEAQTHFHLTYIGLLSRFTQTQGRAESWMRFFPDHTGYDRLSINTSAALKDDTGTAAFWGKNKYFIRNAPPLWMFAPTFGHVHHETTHGVDELEYYGRHIPWAGSVILRIGQQAKAHPHITTVLKSLHPKF